MEFEVRAARKATKAIKARFQEVTGGRSCAQRARKAFRGAVHTVAANPLRAPFRAGSTRKVSHRFQAVRPFGRFHRFSRTERSIDFAGDIPSAILGHYRRPDGNYDLDAVAHDWFRWPPIAAVQRRAPPPSAA